MNPDPLSTNDHPMNYKDALIVALIIAISVTFTVFMPTHGYDIMAAEPPRFIWDLIVFFVTAFLTNFGILAGLTMYTIRTKEPP